jgi:hypothetical protein
LILKKMQLRVRFIPIPAADNYDRGGDAVHVETDGTGEPDEREAWSAGSNIDWASESFVVTSREVYAKLPSGSSVNLLSNYVVSESAAVRMQLEASVRLGILLYRAFG